MIHKTLPTIGVVMIFVFGIILMLVSLGLVATANIVIMDPEERAAWDQFYEHLVGENDSVQQHIRATTARLKELCASIAESKEVSVKEHCE
jgi:hypothetical protein